MDPSPSAWHAAWGELAIVLLLAAAYVRAHRRWPASRGRRAAFAASQLAILAVFVTPVQTLSVNYLLSAHLFQNVVLAEWAPALAVAGLGPGVAAALGRLGPVRGLTHPFVALPLWLAVYAFWHVPAVYDAALRRPDSLLHAEHASYFLAGVLLWWPVFCATPRPVPSGVKAAYVFAAFILASPIGLLLALVPSAVYDYYVEAPRVWGVSPLLDQQLAGVLMSVAEAAVFFGVFAACFARFLAEEDSQAVGRREPP